MVFCGKEYIEMKFTPVSYILSSILVQQAMSELNYTELFPGVIIFLKTETQ